MSMRIMPSKLFQNNNFVIFFLRFFVEPGPVFNTVYKMFIYNRYKRFNSVKFISAKMPFFREKKGFPINSVNFV